MTKKLEKELYKIAAAYSYAAEERGNLKEKDNDSEDFLDINVAALEAMLKAAYELGKNSK